MIKSYFRYTKGSTFGDSCSNLCNAEFREKDSTIAVGSIENVIFFNSTTGETQSKLHFEKRSFVTQIKILEDDFYSSILVGFQDGDIIMRSLLDDAEVNEDEDLNTYFTEHEAAVQCFAVNNEGNLLASGGADNLVVLWDVLGKTPITKFRGHTQTVLTLNFVKVGMVDYLISGGKDGILRVWDTSINECVQIVRTNKNEVTCSNFFPESNLIIYGTDSEDILFVEAKNFGKNEDTKLPEYIKIAGSYTREYFSKVDQITYSKGSKQLVLLSDRKYYEFLDFRSKEEVLKKFKRKVKRAKEAKKEYELTKEEFSADYANWIDAAGRVKSKSKLNSIIQRDTVKSFRNVIYSFFANNTFALGQVISGNPTKLDPLMEFEKQAHQGVIRALALASDDSMIVSSSNESIKIWSIESNYQRIKNIIIQNIVAIKFLPGDRYIVTGSSKGILGLVDSRSGETVFKLEDAHSDSIWSIDWHENPEGLNGITIITGSADGTIKFWEIRMVDKKIKLVCTYTHSLGDAVQWCKFSPNGKFFGGGMIDNSVRLYYCNSKKTMMNFYGHKMPVLCFDISSDNILMVSGSADKYLKIWGMDFGDCHKSLHAHTGPVTQVQFIKDTHYIISASRDGSIKYWDGDTKTLIHDIEAHMGDIWTLVVSSIGDFVITAGSDKVVRVFTQSRDLVYPRLENDDRTSKVTN